ncbi:16S rRNA processing protein RimM [Clostridium novyi B str. ATCC 27606]|uniref:Ribosome maturation factor RimM n=2 Tax=Clostridium TaxID=1485 RepID=A0AA40IVF2_CLONO|nr:MULTISPECIES: ribosome maturation factor RimM [Clostridium]KEI13623.1 16S rRNA processing protein RimM [Clostridium novyi B str. NCTC 9691]KEI17056.1 16S rRNA processing protein RimM [Clostridium haemolyticum NCTC 9693]KEI17579.1 16S rRNA processing protein RimM [Clostridium novyi B str. ATCC 27606]KGN01093.1 16S rRNA processing protein RimM [Clostridium haemolyticum NCTC 8350]OOB76220.1 ribosome maturation factor RimM [Clostridium haemolyticum]
MEQFLAVGKIINTHGLKGEIKLLPSTDDVERFKQLKKAYIDGEVIEIEGCKFQPGKVILKIKDVDSIEQAQRLKNKYIKVSRENAAKLPEGCYYEADIVGCIVYDENDKELGKIDEIIRTGSNDVYWIKGKNELLIPAIKSVIVSIDVNSKKIVIKPLEVWQ